MKKLVLGTILIAGLLQGGAGCIISDDDDDDDVSDDVTDDGDDTGEAEFLFRAEFTCPPDADQVLITPTPVGSGQSQEGELFDCAETFGEILFSPGDFDIEVLPVNDADEDFLALTATISGDDGDEVIVPFDFPQDGGFFQLTWTIDEAEPELSCAEIGADAVAVDATFLDEPDLELVDEFPCEDGIGITDFDPEGWPIGEYVLDISLIDAEGVAISDPAPLSGEFIDFADQLNDIGNVNFQTDL
jgi:hypothetical protein